MTIRTYAPAAAGAIMCLSAFLIGAQARAMPATDSAAQLGGDNLQTAGLALPKTPHPIAELSPVATWRLGKTADWVAVTEDAVWVASTGPFAVHRIDPRTNKLTASVRIPGEACAGLVAAFGALWVPICGQPAALAKIDLASQRLATVLGVGPAAEEGGIAASDDSLWLVVDKKGSLARIDPQTGSIRQTVHIPAGSYNPKFVDGAVWVTRAEGAEATAVDATSGKVIASAKTGPQPRFLAAGGGAMWTLNQGDGTLTRIDLSTRGATVTIPLGTPGHGGDVGFGGGAIWTSMPKVPLSAVSATSAKLLCQWVGPGGDSLGLGHDAIWLTDYHGGTVTRFRMADALQRCTHGTQSGH